MLLKGPTTVVAHPDARVRLSLSGDSRLATAGTGDVLAGIIGSLLAQGVDAFAAAAAGAWLHGEAAMRGPARGLVASDLPAALPAVLADVEAASPEVLARRHAAFPAGWAGPDAAFPAGLAGPHAALLPWKLARMARSLRDLLVRAPRLLLCGSTQARHLLLWRLARVPRLLRVLLVRAPGFLVCGSAQARRLLR